MNQAIFHYQKNVWDKITDKQKKKLRKDRAKAKAKNANIRAKAENTSIRSASFTAFSICLCPVQI
jgi:TRAP-type C4-dicarboxylate transport system substrate-binding protein